MTDWIGARLVHETVIAVHATPAYEGGPLTISHEIEPCVLHLDHSPVTIINELHHIRPQYLQRSVWGSVTNSERLPICATGHNSVHYALGKVLSGKPIPRWCVGLTRDLVEWTVAWWTAVSSGAPDPGYHA